MQRISIHNEHARRVYHAATRREADVGEVRGEREIRARGIIT